MIKKILCKLNYHIWLFRGKGDMEQTCVYCRKLAIQSDPMSADEETALSESYKSLLNFNPQDEQPWEYDVSDKQEGRRNTECPQCHKWFHMCGSCDAWDWWAGKTFCSEKCWESAEKPEGPSGPTIE